MFEEGICGSIILFFLNLYAYLLIVYQSSIGQKLNNKPSVRDENSESKLISIEHIDHFHRPLVGITFFTGIR